MTIRSIKGLLVAGVVFLFLIYVSSILSLGARLLPGTSLFIAIPRVIFDIALIAAPFFAVWLYLVKPLCDFKALDIDEVKKAFDGKDPGHVEAVLSVADVISRSPACTDGERAELTSGNVARIEKAIQQYFDTRKEQSRPIAEKLASMAALSVAVSGSSSIDALAMLYWKGRMVYETIKCYGFRPRIREMLRIYIHVLGGAFVAGSLEEMADILDVGAFFGKGGNILTKALAASVQGTYAIWSILRASELTRYYIIHGTSEQTRKEAIKKANEYATNNFMGALNVENIQKTAKTVVEGVGKTVGAHFNFQTL